MRIRDWQILPFAIVLGVLATPPADAGYDVPVEPISAPCHAQKGDTQYNTVAQDRDSVPPAGAKRARAGGPSLSLLRLSEPRIRSIGE